MNLVATLALLAAALGAYVGLLAWRFRRAPGLEDQGWFALVACSASAYTAFNLVITSEAASVELVLWASKLQLLLSVVHVVAWFRYASAFLGRAWPREGALAWGLVLAALPVLLPGVGFTGEVSLRPVASAGVAYRDAAPSSYGVAVLGLVLATFLTMAARFAAAWRRRVPYAGVHVGALALLFAMGLNDLLTLTGLVQGVYVLDLGFLAPVGAVAYALSGRVVDEARALAVLRGELERTVAARTAALASSQEALLRAEKLAALGQFSAGVSHEVANPAAVVAANLRYLEEALQAGDPPPDARQCLAESREAVDRISRLTRQLLDASRLASAPQTPAERLALAEVVAAAVGGAGPRLDGRRVEVSVPDDLCALGQAPALTEVLVRLLDNAVRSLRPGAGRVAVRGERALGRARLVVEDDGAGMSAETLGRAFDPFFSTRAFGTGKGLGLAVARGLVQAMRGDLRLESAPGRGTRAIVELPLAEPPGPGAPPLQASPA